jgi:2-oxoglutarate dehydrogenase E2 component (dihydrolipoamide succinyltransferase)
MPIVDLVMPKMGESIMEATILHWNKKPGESIKQEEAVLEIATDKVDSEVPSTAEGVLEEVLFQENDVVPVGTVIARIRTAGEGVETPPVNAPAAPQRETAPASQASTHQPANYQASAYQEAPQEPAYQEAGAEEEALMQSVPYQPQPITLNGSPSGGARFYSPLVLNIASSEGISLAELESIAGTGNEGRVTKKDILSYLDDKRSGRVHTAQATRGGVSAGVGQGQPSAGQGAPASGYPATKPVSGEPITASGNVQGSGTVSVGGTPQGGAVSVGGTYGASSGQVEIIEMDRMRKLIAKHMVESKHVSAHVTSFAEADVTNMVLWRDKIKKTFEQREGEKITFTPLFVEAIVRCLKRYPWLNSSVTDDKIIVKKDINIGMATALPSGNLIVPVIRNADQLNLVGLTKQVNGLANAARSGKLKPEDTQGGTFTLTNVGSFGSIMGTPIINQPQVAILAVGVIKKRPVVVETEQGDSIAIRHMMYLSLSYDHRVIDGAMGSTFLSAVAAELEGFDPNKNL